MKNWNIIWCLVVLCFVVPGWTDDDHGSSERHTPIIPCITNTNAYGVCVPVANCPELHSYNQRLNRKYCSLYYFNGPGVCCPNNLIPEMKDTIFGLEERATSVPSADKQLNLRDQLEQTLLAQGLVVRPNTAEARHKLITFAFKEAIQLGRIGFITSESTRVFLLGKNETSVLSISKVDGRPIDEVCPKEPVCQKTKYRTIDGSCNNLINNEWGKAFRAFQRMTPPTYADGISKPRVAADGADLTSCRLISSTIIKDHSREYKHIDSMFVTYGQFIDHDLSFTPTATGANESGILCCPPLIQPEFRHPECMEIGIPANDPFYSQFNQSCMEFVRTIPAPLPDCALGPREQINQLTNYLDGSMIYGSSEEQSLSLRDKTGGRLRVGSSSRGREFPPHLSSSECGADVNRGMFFFIAGDVRVGEQPVLSVLHIIFLREHNRIAALLRYLNPRWNDEILFQESRRIVQAELQHITYREFLPILLGEATMKQFNLELSKTGYFNQYNSSLDATIFNEFATAAYRYGHSLVQSQTKLVGRGHIQVRQLRNLLLEPFDVSLFNKFARGATTQASELMDENVTPELTNHLFEINNKFGLDLVAFDCQRGRDHAIGTYTQLRQFCGLPPIESFSDLTYFMNSDVAQRFFQVYSSVHDIDLFMGGVAEWPMQGAVVGPTFSCIIAEQFKRLRLGDRLWYERGNTKSSFSLGQLTEIRKTSLARILCDNTYLDEIQPLALIRGSHWNKKVSCKSRGIPKMNLDLWKREPI